MSNKQVIIFFAFFVVGCTKSIPARMQSKSGLNFEPLQHILIHESSSLVGPCEPTICINQNNPAQIIAASVLDNVYISDDYGTTWKNKKLTSTYGVYGDPVVRVNKDGTFLFAHLANSKGKAYASEEFLDRIVVQKSNDAGKSWSNGSFPKVNHAKDHDKHWLYVDPKSGVVLMSWTEFDIYGSKEASSKSRILFSKSMDGGYTWTDALTISEFEGDCLDDDMTTEGAHPSVGIDGTFYVTWSFNNKIYLDVSKDGGVTWLKQDKVIADQPMGWSFDIPGIGRCNGMPVMDIDHTGGPNNGHLYVSWGDLRNGEDDADIWLIKSMDGGNNWSAPKRVNNDKPGKHQFFSWMDIDQTTGNIYFVFYDRRNYEDNQTDVYLAYSIDGGLSFENIKISDKPFTPESYVFFGDYNDISAHAGYIRPIWAAQEKNKLSIHTAILNVIK